MANGSAPKTDSSAPLFPKKRKTFENMMLDKVHDFIWRSVSYLSVPLLRCDQSVWSHVNYTSFPLCSFISAKSSQATRQTSQRAGFCSGTGSAECLLYWFSAHTYLVLTMFVMQLSAIGKCETAFGAQCALCVLCVVCCVCIVCVYIRESPSSATQLLDPKRYQVKA